MQTIASETGLGITSPASENDLIGERGHGATAVGTIDRVLEESGWESPKQYPAMLDKLLWNECLLKAATAVGKFLFKLSDLLAKAARFLIARLALIAEKREMISQNRGASMLPQQTVQFDK
jgi:hypothetical protein